jgi:SAM-dependent methyltransferase
MSGKDENPKALADFSQTMKHDWNSRAVENAKWFINTYKLEQSDDEFYATGKPEVEKFIINDPMLTRGRDFSSLRLLEIGCGIGRMTMYLAQLFGEVHSTDVSGEMIAQARERFRSLKHVTFHETSGVDFSALPNDFFDIIFSVYVFQHTPSVDVIRSNIRDACRTLKPGGVFKFQTSGVTSPTFDAQPRDTWTGASFLEPDIRRAARENGVQLLSLTGLGEQYCWTFLRKPLKAAGNPAGSERPEIRFYGRSDAPGLKSIPLDSHLTLLVSGLDLEVVDANNVIVEINGQAIFPYAVHDVGEEFAHGGQLEDLNSVERLAQIEIRVPESARIGSASVRVKTLEGLSSETISVELIAPQLTPPKVELVTNIVDGGVDIYTRGEKSVVRIFASGMNDGATPENVSVLVGEHILKPISVSPLEANGLHMAIAKMPENLLTQEVEIRIQFHELISESKQVPIIV